MADEYFKFTPTSSGGTAIGTREIYDFSANDQTKTFDFEVPANADDVVFVNNNEDAGTAFVQIAYENGYINYTFTGAQEAAYTSSAGGDQAELDVTYSYQSVVAKYVQCFAQGTRVLTARGNVAVEHLAVGDVVIAKTGNRRAIRWLGHRAVDCRHDPIRTQPIRITAHAFGEGTPSRLLFLSPGHPVLVGADDDGQGGVLVPIMCLINGTTVERAHVENVTYWHVELDEHDVLMAEGLAAESYIDIGSRQWFDGADDTLCDPDYVAPEMSGRCRPVVIEGPIVDAERKRLDILFVSRLSAACAWPSLHYGSQ